MTTALLAVEFSSTLASYRPFLDPIEMHRLWYLLLIPLAALVSLSYKAVRVADLRDLPRQVAVMTVQIVLGIAALGVAGYLVVEWVIPAVAP